MDPIFIAFTAIILLMFLSARIHAARQRRRLGRSGGSFVYDMFSSSSDSYASGSYPSDAPHSGHHHGSGHHYGSGHHGHSHTSHDGGMSHSHSDSGGHGGGGFDGGGGHSH